MFRRFFTSKAHTALSSSEEAAVLRLASAYSRLVYDECNRVDTQSEHGVSACNDFLECLEAAAQTISAEKAPRSYRSRFTKNYQTLFPGEDRHYRVDVLDASSEDQPEMWVNGERFQFSKDTMKKAKVLQTALPELKSLFGADSCAASSDKADVCSALVALDFAWAGFEQTYIIELIEIEAKARALLLEAVKHARHLDALESRGHANGRVDCREVVLFAEWNQAQSRLVSCIAQMNAVANTQRKGRDDLGVEVLSESLSALRRCDAEDVPGSRASAARMLAGDVVESFASMRKYLGEARKHVESVDPHLCNNPGLVERLADWEESWELGSRYVVNPKMLKVLSSLVDEIYAAEKMVPALTKMREDCDVELFMVLPRMVWLHFLMQPAEHEELLASLLPHRFQRKMSFDGRGAPESDIVQRTHYFEHVKQLLTSQRNARQLTFDSQTWRVFMQRMVNGDCDGSIQISEQQKSALDKFMHDLEGWSMELQRHCPEDWNQLSSVLVQCLTGDEDKPSQSAFRV